MVNFINDNFRFVMGNVIFEKNVDVFVDKVKTIFWPHTKKDTNKCVYFIFKFLNVVQNMP